MHVAAGSAALGAAMLRLSGVLNGLASQTTACSLFSRAEAAEIPGKPAVATATPGYLDDRGSGGWAGPSSHIPSGGRDGSRQAQARDLPVDLLELM